MKPNLLILGGDQRNRIVLDILRERGFSVEYFSDTRRENTQAILQHISQNRVSAASNDAGRTADLWDRPCGALEACPAQPFVLRRGHTALDKGLPG